MKTIEQQVTVKFHAVEAQDVVTMLPVVDTLISDFHELCSQFDEALDRGAYEGKDYYLDIAENAVEKYNQIKVLFNFGFISSKPITLREHEALTIAYHYGLGNEVQLCMQNGSSPLAALKEFDIL